MDRNRSAAFVFVGAALLGTIVGAGTARWPAGLYGDNSAAARPERVRAPHPGDRWNGCNDARAAGTAPIYRSEPGYREDMDGDGDGIACEPHHME